MASDSALPIDVRLMNGVASALFVLVGLGLLAALLLARVLAPAPAPASASASTPEGRQP